MTNYLEVPAYLIPDGTRRLAEWTAEVVAKLIGTPGVAVRWFAPGQIPSGAAWPWWTHEQAAGTDGFVEPLRPRVVWIRADLSRREVIATVAHELVHSKQLVQGQPVTRNRDLAEQHAKEFGEAFARRVDS